MSLKLTDLEIFVAIVEAGSISRAADNLGAPKSRIVRGTGAVFLAGPPLVTAATLYHIQAGWLSPLTCILGWSEKIFFLEIQKSVVWKSWQMV